MPAVMERVNRMGCNELFMQSQCDRSACARPRTLRTSRCLAATCGSVAATRLEAMPRLSRQHRRPLRGAPSAGHESGPKARHEMTRKSSFLLVRLIDTTDLVSILVPRVSPERSELRQQSLKGAAFVSRASDADRNFCAAPLEVPQIFDVQNRGTPVNKGRSRVFRFALSENPQCGVAASCGGCSPEPSFAES